MQAPDHATLLAALAGDGAAIKKRSVRLRGHETSVSLEGLFWRRLQELAGAQGKSMNALVMEIDESRAGNLSSALRVYVTASLTPGTGG